MHPTVSPCTQAIWSSSIGTGGRHASERVDFFIGMPSGRFKLRKNAYFAYHGNSRPTWHSGKRDYAALAPSQWTDPQGSGWQGEMVRVPQRLKDWRRLDWREFASVPA
jgi:hypothetical protein